MSIITKVLRQKAVYWAHTGDNKFGKPTYADPIEIACRWNDQVDQVTDAKGRTVNSRAFVFVDRALVLGSLLQKGLLVDAPDTPMASNGCYEVLRVNETPNLRAKEFLRSVYV